MREFSHVLGQVLQKPAWIVVPAFVLRLVFGPMADETLLASQKAIPKRLREAGFTFQYPELRTALEAIIQGGNHESG
jgi:NAD dependent epimerase/dehydratase family enzyme